MIKDSASPPPLPETPPTSGGDDTKVEAPRKFVPTPEIISQCLKMDHEKVAVALGSVAGREELCTKLLKHEETLRALDPSFNPEELRAQLDLVGATLHAKEEFLKDVQSPEKKNVFRRMWDKVKGFPKKHPIITALLVIAGVAWGVSRIWKYLGSAVSVPNPMTGAAAVAGEGAAATGGSFGAIREWGIGMPNLSPGGIEYPGSAPLPDPGILTSPMGKPPLPNLEMGDFPR